MNRANGGCVALVSQTRLGGSFPGAEVVGEHRAANPGGVAIAVPLHISSSAFLAPEGVVRPLQYLRSRTLARHTHAMLKGGATLVTSVSRARLASFRAQPVVVGGANGLRTLLRRALDRYGGLEHGAARFVPGRLAQHCQRQDFRHHGGHVCRRSGSSPRLLCGPHLVQQVEVVDNSPTTPHWPVRLTLKATSCGHRVLARQRPGRAEETLDDLELARLEWLRAAEAEWCRSHNFYGAQRRLFPGRSKGLVIEHVSLGQATRKDTRRSCSRKARCAAWWPRLWATWLPGGRGLALGMQAGSFQNRRLW